MAIHGGWFQSVKIASAERSTCQSRNQLTERTPVPNFSSLSKNREGDALVFFLTWQELNTVNPALFQSFFCMSLGEAQIENVLI